MGKADPKQSDHAYRTISRAEILARLRDSALLLVDVMPKVAFETGHIPRSVNLPLEDIETGARLILPDLTREVAVYCAGPD